MESDCKTAGSCLALDVYIFLVWLKSDIDRFLLECNP